MELGEDENPLTPNNKTNSKVSDIRTTNDSGTFFFFSLENMKIT